MFIAFISLGLRGIYSTLDVWNHPTAKTNSTSKEPDEIEINVGLKLKLKNNKVYGEVTIKKESLKLTC